MLSEDVVACICAPTLAPSSSSTSTMSLSPLNVLRHRRIYDPFALVTMQRDAMERHNQVRVHRVSRHNASPACIYIALHPQHPGPRYRSRRTDHHRSRIACHQINGPLRYVWIAHEGAVPVRVGTIDSHFCCSPCITVWAHVTASTVQTAFLCTSSSPAYTARQDSSYISAFNVGTQRPRRRASCRCCALHSIPCSGSITPSSSTWSEA